MNSKNEKYLKYASMILIIAGIFDTIMIIRAIMTESSYSGGSIIYIVAGYKLLKKNEKVYKTVRTLGLPLLALGIAGILSYIISFYMKLDANILSINSFTMIDSIMLLYAIMIPITMMLLWHPKTQEIFSEKIINTSIKTLFIKKNYFIFTMVGSLILFGLLNGPNLLKSPPYKIAKNELIKHYNENIENNKNKYDLYILWHHTGNWTFYSQWKLVDSNNEIIYYFDLTPQNDIRIDYKIKRINESNERENYKIFFKHLNNLKSSDIDSILFYKYKNYSPEFSISDIPLNHCSVINDRFIINKYVNIFKTKYTSAKSNYYRYLDSYYFIAKKNNDKVLELIIENTNHENMRDMITHITYIKTFSNSYGGTTYYNFGKYVLKGPNPFLNLNEDKFKNSEKNNKP